MAITSAHIPLVGTLSVGHPQLQGRLGSMDQQNTQEEEDHVGFWLADSSLSQKITIYTSRVPAFGDS